MTASEKFSENLTNLTTTDQELANRTIRQEAFKRFTIEEWTSMTENQKAMFRSLIIANLAMELTFSK
jgi:hypothetical protein